MAEPKRKKDRSDMLLAQELKSRMLKLEPSLQMPNILIELPRRTNERILIVDPSCAKSSTLNDEPRRVMP
jgi:hypothetical protein